MEIKVAVLVDGDFFLKRYRSLSKHKPGFNQYDPVQTAKDLQDMIRSHIKYQPEHEKQYLYRTLFYDCFPFTKKVHNPVTGKAVDYSKSKVAEFRIAFLEELKKQRKVALRLGALKDHAGWVLRTQKTKELLNRKITVDDLKDDDVFYDLSQKGVDMRIGLDSEIFGIAITPDGKRVVSGSKDTTLKVWDLQTGRCLATFEGHTSDVYGVAVTPDGRRAVSASADCTLRVPCGYGTCRAWMPLSKPPPAPATPMPRWCWWAKPARVKPTWPSGWPKGAGKSPNPPTAWRSGP
ncbi:MAG: hypothetical protein NT166_22920 [Candidatus Aminicenantes bacterium]|nr:hypothetical protein [Candidatus Aminicenantes bacterium]